MILAIAVMEKKLQCHQSNAIKHQHYFSNLIKDNTLLLIAIMVPIFFIGWKISTRSKLVIISRQFAQLAFLALLASIRAKAGQSIARIV